MAHASTSKHLNDSDDDFVSNSPVLSQTLIKKNQKIPVGHVLTALKWRNSPVVQKMSESIKVLFSSDLGVVDFHPSGDIAVIFISASDLVEGKLYRKRIAGLKAVKGIKKIVVAERTPITIREFSNLQKFAVIELELDLIPITENTLHTLIVQMVSLESKMKKNLFVEPPKGKEPVVTANHITAALKTIPKLGDKKASLLIERFGSLQKVASASQDDLVSILGSTLGKTVWEFFNRRIC